METRICDTKSQFDAHSQCQFCGSDKLTIRSVAGHTGPLERNDYGLYEIMPVSRFTVWAKDCAECGRMSAIYEETGDGA